MKKKIVELGEDSVTVRIQPQTRNGAAYEIAEMFACMEETSFVRDIAPVLFREFSYKALDMNLCAAAQATIEEAIDLAMNAGRPMKCVPQFSPTVYGVMEVSDLIYRRA